MGFIEDMKRKKASKDAEKKAADKRQIAEMIVSCREARDDLANVVAEYERSAEEAAALGQNEYVDELLESVVDMEGFIDDLKFLELDLKTTAVTVSAFDKLKNLPAALAACKNIFKNGVNFETIGAEMAELRSTLKNAREQFRSFRQSLSRDKSDVYQEVWGENRKTNDPERERRIADKKKALEAKLAISSAAAPTPTEQTVTVDNQDVAKIDAIAAMIDDEKKSDD